MTAAHLAPITSRPAIAFEGMRRIAVGPLADVARAVKVAELRGFAGALFIFDASTSQPIELDLRGSIADVLERLKQSDAAAQLIAESALESDETSRGPGRPRLGVIGREVTLLPRHWEWLASQPGGASAALRRLVDQARVTFADRDRLRAAQESAYRFLSAMLSGNEDFDEAARAFFADDRERFRSITAAWPADARDHAWALADAAFTERERPSA